MLLYDMIIKIIFMSKSYSFHQIVMTLNHLFKRMRTVSKPQNLIKNSVLN